MTDIVNSDWAELDANNTNPSPNGIQGGYSPSQVAPIMRSMRGALKRFYVQTNALVTSTGTGNAYVLTYGAAPSGYSKGIIYRFYAHADATGAATLNINGLGVKQILSLSGQPLTAGQIKTGRIVEVAFNGTSFEVISVESHDAKFTGNTSFTGNTFFIGNTSFAGSMTGNGALLTSLNASAVTTGTLADARLPGTMAGKTFTNVIAVDQAADRALYLRTAASVTSVIYGSEASTGAAFVNVHDAAGAYIRQLKMPRTGNMTWDGQTVWTAGNDGVGSGLNAGLLAGLPADSTAGSNSIVVRDANADIAVRDAVIARNTTSGYLYFTTNKSISFGFDGTYVRSTGASFKSNGDIFSTGGMYSTGEVMSTTGQIVSQGGNNTHFWHKNGSGVSRAVIYYAPAAEQHFVQLYNTAGTAVRAYSYKQSDGQFNINGYLATSQNCFIGSAQYTTEGNVTFNGGMAGFGGSLYDALNARIKNDGGTYAINVTGNAGTASAAAISATLRQSGTGAGMTFNWSGQAGQPSWMWGGDSPTNMYVYNPSNFSVSQANNATNLAGLDSNQWARIAYSTNNLETAYPMGTYLPAYSPGGVPRNHDRNLRLDTATTLIFRADGVGTLMSGTWRCKGYLSNDMQLYQRVG
jgi:hypothetical protein